jgi:hypothetical protein
MAVCITTATTANVAATAVVVAATAAALVVAPTAAIAITVVAAVVSATLLAIAASNFGSAVAVDGGVGQCQLPGIAFEAVLGLPQCWQHSTVLGWGRRLYQSLTPHPLASVPMRCCWLRPCCIHAGLQGRQKRSNMDCILSEIFE